MEDARFLFDLRNEKSNREMFKNSDIVKWESHLDWIRDRLKQEGCFIFIALNENHIPIGQFKIDITCEVSISLSEKFKGQGLGAKIITLGTRIFRNKFKNILIANIKEDNIASINSFLKAGYIYEKSIMAEGVIYQRYIFN